MQTDKRQFEIITELTRSDFAQFPELWGFKSPPL